MLRQYIIFIFTLVLLASCNGPGGIKKRVTSLDETITDYNVAWRWGFFNKIEDYHRKNDDEEQKFDRSSFKNIRITGYSISEKIINEDIDEATVTGVLNYYNNEYGTLKELPFTHHWWYEEESKRWFNGSDYPEFK